VSYGSVTPIYGLLAEFDSPTEVVEAAEGGSLPGTKDGRLPPFRLKACQEAIGFRRTRLPLIIFIGCSAVWAVSGFSIGARKLIIN
jgi:hypothetical protein